MIDPLGHVAELWRLEDGNLTPYSYLQDTGELRSHILPGFSVQLADLLA